MHRNYKILITVAALLITAFLAWYFSTVVAYILISLVISFLGQPVTGLLDRIHIRKWRLPHTFNAFVALILIVAVFLTLAGIFVPVIIYEAEVISSIDIDKLNAFMKGPLAEINDFLHRYGMVQDQVVIEEMITARLQSIFDFSFVSYILTNLVGLTSSIYMGLFSILFISFFLIKDEHLFHDAILTLVNKNSQDEVSRILTDSRKMLSRYFVGLLMDMFVMSMMISFGLWLLGIKNALLIGILGGLLNVIPYIGPLIGAFFGILLALTSMMSLGIYEGLGWVIVAVSVVFAAAKLLDDILFQPFIFSSSVKAHPLEIFLVIIMAGTIAGIPGMILAIPAYTVIRIIAREFLSRFPVVQKLTGKL